MFVVSCAGFLSLGINNAPGGNIFKERRLLIHVDTQNLSFDKRQQKQACRCEAAAGPNDLNLKVEATDSGVCPGVFKRIENSELSTSPTPSNNYFNPSSWKIKFFRCQIIFQPARTSFFLLNLQEEQATFAT